MKILFGVLGCFTLFLTEVLSLRIALFLMTYQESYFEMFVSFLKCAIETY